MTDKIHCWDGQKFFECMNGAEEKFTARVDWDTDIYSSGEGCHGRDLFGKGDSVNIDFSVFKDGNIVASLREGLSSHRDEYVMTIGNQLFKRTSVELMPVNVVQHPPKLFTLTRPSQVPTLGYLFDTVLADQSFLNCYHDSQNLNLDLADQQKAVVERFFAAVKAAFPRQFGGQQVATPQKADTLQQTSLPWPRTPFLK